MRTGLTRGADPTHRYLNGVTNGTRYEGTFDGGPSFGSCDDWTDSSRWSAQRKQELLDFTLAQMDAFQVRPRADEGPGLDIETLTSPPDGACPAELLLLDVEDRSVHCL